MQADWIKVRQDINTCFLTQAVCFEGGLSANCQLVYKGLIYKAIAIYTPVPPNQCYYG
jgi:hypothetical protein